MSRMTDLLVDHDEALTDEALDRNHEAKSSMMTIWSRCRVGRAGR